MSLDVSAGLPAPVAEWVDPFELMADPYPSYKRLRELGPVVFAPSMDRYLITRYDAVRDVLNDASLFSSHSFDEGPLVQALGGRSMVSKDDPDHATERGAINPTMRPRRMKEVWSPKFTQAVETWIDHMLEIGPEEADLNRDFAGPVASQNLIDLLGFPPDTDVNDMRRWSTDLVAGIGNVVDDQDIWRRVARTTAEVDAVLDDLLRRLKHKPDHSIISHLQQVGLPEDLVRANVRLTISGGMNEPQHMVTNMVWSLSQYPDQRAAARAGDVTWGAVFEETVRWLSPIQADGRRSTQEVNLHGSLIPENSDLFILLASANRDEAVYSDGDSFDINRNAPSHFGFGGGVHLCAGKYAARTAIGETAIPKLYERLPGLAIDESRKSSWDGFVFRGLVTCPVTW